MIINTVILAGNLTADADIQECRDKPGRFKLEFAIAVNHPRRKSDAASDRATFIHVKSFASENAAVFFSSSLYKGREVLVTGELASRTTISQGAHSTFYFIEASSVEVVPVPTDFRQRDAGDRNEEAQFSDAGYMAPEPPAPPQPRKLAVRRPGQPAAPSAPSLAPQQLREPMQRPEPTPAQRYRDKGVDYTPVVEADSGNLCRW